MLADADRYVLLHSRMRVIVCVCVHAYALTSVERYLVFLMSYPLVVHGILKLRCTDCYLIFRCMQHSYLANLYYYSDAAPAIHYLLVPHCASLLHSLLSYVVLCCRCCFMFDCCLLRKVARCQSLYFTHWGIYVNEIKRPRATQHECVY